MQCQLPISCRTSKEQHLAGNSLQLLHPVSPFVHFSVTHASDTNVYFTAPGGEGSSSLSTGPGPAGAVTGIENENSEAAVPCFTALPTHSTQAEVTIWSINYRRWVNRRMNSNHSCLLEICDCCFRVEQQNHIQKMPVGQWTSRVSISNTSSHFQKSIARWGRQRCLPPNGF